MGYRVYLGQYVSVLSVHYVVGFVVLVRFKPMTFSCLLVQSSVISVIAQYWRWIKNGKGADEGRTWLGKFAVWFEMSNPSIT